VVLTLGLRISTSKSPVAVREVHLFPGCANIRTCNAWRGGCTEQMLLDVQ
jgi:hypothetical protein